MKKVILLILVAVMVFSAAGCRPKKHVEIAPTPTAAAPSTAGQTERPSEVTPEEEILPDEDGEETPDETVIPELLPSEQPAQKDTEKQNEQKTQNPSK